MAGWSNDIDPGSEFDMWHSSQWPDGINYGKYHNPEVDRLVVEGRREFDHEARKKIYFREQEILADEQPYMFLYYPASLVAVDKRFRGVVPSPQGIGRYYPGFLAWWVPPGLQRYGAGG